MNRDPEQFRSKLSRRTAALLTAGIALAASGCSANSSTFEGGCDTFQVYAQGRWNKLGAAVRVAPDLAAKQVEGIAANHKIETNGWVDTKKPVYPHNTPPWNSGIWFHLAPQEGKPDLWVSFPGVRGEETTYDKTGLLNGGKPAPTTLECEGTYHPK